MDENLTIRRALISVYNKDGLLELAEMLLRFGVEIISTGGTAQFLRDKNISVTNVSEITGFPEILDGRVKTLHPRIHGALLAKRDKIDHLQQLQEYAISLIDLVVVNLYPFEQVVSNPQVTLDQALENIDIGGPCMIRAAAKNFTAIAVLTDPSQYPVFISEFLDSQGVISNASRQKFALEAFHRTSQYDTAIAQYLDQTERPNAFPAQVTLSLKKVLDLRYGENPHQSAAFYINPSVPARGMGAMRQLSGKELSFNNILDMNATIGLAMEFADPAVVIIKHNNPCGVAVSDDPVVAFQNALKTDPVSAFGGIVATNRPLSPELAEKLAAIFFEVIIAPDFSPEALEILSKKKNLRLIQWPEDQTKDLSLDLKKVNGGFLLQQPDDIIEDVLQYRVVSKRQPTLQEWQAMAFGWKVAKWVKSNAVIYVNENQTLGIGAGQMSRVDSSKLAIQKAREAGLSLMGSLVVSDAFFPFRDGVDAAAQAGAAAVIQPGGSIRDNEVICAADEHNMAMVFTGIRHFRH